MATQRMLNSKFWSDSYIRKLNFSERYLFLYLLTNEHTNISGVYELSLDVISFETKLEEKEIKTIMRKFENDEKIIYKQDWIFIVNFIKNQTQNPSVITGINRILNSIPNEIHDRLGTGWVQAGGRLSGLNLTKLNLSVVGQADNTSSGKELNSLIKKYHDIVKQHKGYEAKTTVGDVKNLKAFLKESSEEEIIAIFNWYVKSDKFKEFPNLSSAISAHSVNLFRGQKNRTW